MNVGCIPKKLMHHIANLNKLRKDQKEVGFDLDPSKPITWQQMMATVNNHVRSLNFKYRTSLRGAGIKYYNAFASLENKHLIKLVSADGKEEKVTAEHILISVGGRPRYLDLPGCKEYCQSSDDIFWSKEEFGKTLVIGSGYIGVECGGFLRGFGKEVHIMYRSVVLRSFDQDIVERIVKHMKGEGVKFIKGLPKKFEKNSEGKIEVFYSVTDEEGNVSERSESYDNVLLSVGRDPETSKIGLQALNVKYDKKNHLVVNSKFQTSVDNIYAIGDVISNALELTPVAIKEGQILAEGLFGKEKKWDSIDYSLVPTTIFSPLEYSSCGLSEKSAVEKYSQEKITVYHSAFKPLEWSVNYEYDSGICYWKIVCLKEGEKILGIHYLGPNAGEVMQGFAVILKMGGSYKDIRDTVGIHPTTAEEFMKIVPTKEE